MSYFLYLLAFLFLLFIAFIIWRITSVARGGRQRDEKIYDLLTPLGNKLAQKETVTAEDVAAIAATRQVRPLLYEALKKFELSELFSQQYLSEAAQGEALLSYWMMHPNELQDPPERIELVEAVTRPLRKSGGDKSGGDQSSGDNSGGDNSVAMGTFYVYRYQMPAGHWAGTDWLLGLAGPFRPGDLPFFNGAAAFSRAGDKQGQTAPAEIVDWYIDMAASKGAPWIER